MVPLSYNVRNLFVRKATTIATALGIALVVFVLASALMLSAGIRKTMGSSGRRDHAFVIRKGSDAELSSSIETRTVGLILSAPGVKADKTGTPTGAGELVVVITVEKEDGAGQISNVQVRGVTDNVLELRPEARIIAGRPAQPGTDEAIIGTRIRGRFLGMQLGQTFDLKKNRPVKVVGIFEAADSAFESEVWADIDTVRTSYGREGMVSSVTARLESATKLDAFRAAVEHDKQLGLEVLRESDYYEKQSEGSSIVIMALGIFITVFFSLGAMIGATITMHSAVGQRRHEIGTLRALGFSRLSIMFSFLVEAFVLAALGGAIGATAAIAMGLVEIPMMNWATWSEIVFTFTPTPGIVVTSVLAGGIMGLIGGFLPAVRAARISPLVAMRE